MFQSPPEQDLASSPSGVEQDGFEEVRNAQRVVGLILTPKVEKLDTWKYEVNYHLYLSMIFWNHVSIFCGEDTRIIVRLQKSQFEAQNLVLFE